MLWPFNIKICSISIKCFHKIFSKNPSSLKYFHKIVFCGSLEINLSTGRIAGWGKVAYIWISPNSTKVGPTLGAVVAVVSSFVHVIKIINFDHIWYFLKHEKCSDNIHKVWCDWLIWHEFGFNYNERNINPILYDSVFLIWNWHAVAI